MDLYNLWIDALTPWIWLVCFLALAGVALYVIYTPLKRFKKLIDHDYLFLSHVMPIMSEALLHTQDSIRRDPQLEETLSVSYYQTKAMIEKYGKWLEIAKDFSDQHWNKNKVSLKVMADYDKKVREVMS